MCHLFNNMLSILALGTAVSLTHPKSHNADPLGGRINHQAVAKGPPQEVQQGDSTG